MKFRALAAATAAIMVLGPVAVANAKPPAAEPAVLAQGLTGPLFLSVGAGGKIVAVSESFTGSITGIVGEQVTTVYENPGWDVAGSAFQGNSFYFVESQGAGPEDPRPMVGNLWVSDNKGERIITSQLAQHEIDNNLDAAIRYGLSEADVAANPECVAELTTLGLPATYTGADVEVDSHVYGLAVKGNTAYVADAGANAVLAVNLKSGKISTLAVLPAHPVTIPEGAAAGLGVPSCAGLDYSFEAVPTDVEIGPDGKVYVATLPGGPEDGSLGLRGKVFRIDTSGKKITEYASGLLSPTGIAFDGKGSLYVASLFGEGIYKVGKGGTASLFLPAVMAADVDIHGNTLYATTEVFGNGTVISYRL